MAQKSKLDKSRSCDRILSIGGDGREKAITSVRKILFARREAK
jgi:hypothetical protein